MPGSRFARPGMTMPMILQARRAPALLLRRRRALHERLAALHLVSQRRLVDLDHDGIGIDPEVLHQRLRDVAHHAGLLLIGSAGGHAHGYFRHSCLLVPFSFVMAGHSSLLSQTT